LSNELPPELTPRSIPEFSYVAPSTVADAISLLGRYGSKAKVMAGGSDLLHLMKRDAMSEVPEVIVDIKKIGEMQQLDFDPIGGLSMGALVTIGDVERSDVIAEHYPLLGHASDVISVPQVRNVATVGGALAQQVWCPFLRNALKCWRAGGETCFATLEGADNRYYHSVMGGADCYAVHPSDLAVALEALDASVVVAGPYGTKTMLLDDFLPGNVWVGNLLQSHVLSQTELLTAVQVPPPPTGARYTYVKSRIRNAMDFAIASVAVRMSVEEGVVQDSRVVFGGIATSPYRDLKAQGELNGASLSSALPEAVAAVALAGATPLQNNAYKLDVAKGLLKEAILNLSA
jgi:xanthine dehydrogenase YagS FAD-binding subunit